MKKALIILGLLAVSAQTAQAQITDTFGVPIPSVGVNIPTPTFSAPSYGYYGTFPQYGVQASPIFTPQTFGARAFPTPGTTVSPQQPIIQPGIGVLQPGFGQLGQPTFQPRVGVTQPGFTAQPTLTPVQPGVTIPQPGF